MADTLTATGFAIIIFAAALWAFLAVAGVLLRAR